MDNLKSFEDLNCWKEAVLLRKDLKTLTDSLPKHEEYKLKDQLLKCLRSVTIILQKDTEDLTNRRISSFAE